MDMDVVLDVDIDVDVFVEVYVDVDMDVAVDMDMDMDINVDVDVDLDMSVDWPRPIGPFLDCRTLHAQEKKEEVIWISDNWKFMRPSGLEMKYFGVCFEIVIRAMENFQV